MIQHRIHTGDTAPICQQPRCIPAARRKEAQSQVQEMLQKDTIQFFLCHGTVSTLQLVVPHSLRSDVLRELDDSPVGGHLGQDKVIGKLQQRFYWPGSVTDAKQWCSTCPAYAVRKTHPPQQQAPLQTITADAPMQTVAVDILGPFTDSPSENRYILAAMDYFICWGEAYAIPKSRGCHCCRQAGIQYFPPFLST